MKAIKSVIFALAMLATLPSHAQFTTGGSKSSSLNNFSGESISTGYKGIIEFGYGIGVGDFSAGRVELSLVNGYQFCPYFYAGVGVGMNYYHEGSNINLPIFADFRGTLPLQDTKVAPFLDMRLGYSVIDVEGFYFSPSVGVRIATSDDSGVNIGLGYEMQKAKISGSIYGHSYSASPNFGAITIKLGIDF